MSARCASQLGRWRKSRSPGARRIAQSQDPARSADALRWRVRQTADQWRCNWLYGHLKRVAKALQRAKLDLARNRIDRVAKRDMPDMRVFMLHVIHAEFLIGKTHIDARRE